MKAEDKENDGACSGLTILLVEDHTDTREAIKMWFERKGHTVFATDRCKSAIQLGLTKRLDLLVCDIRLPDGEGWPLLKRLRSASKATAELFGISMSCYGHSDAEMAAKSKQSGYFTHLVKPCPAEDMAQALSKVEAVKLGSKSGNGKHPDKTPMKKAAKKPATAKKPAKKAAPKKKAKK